MKIGEKEKWRNKGNVWWYTWYICPLSTCVLSFNLLGLTVPEKSVTKNFNVWKLERKKNEEIKEHVWKLERKKNEEIKEIRDEKL